MATAQRIFSHLGATGEVEIQVRAGGGHVLAASLAVADPNGSWLLKPTVMTFSRFVWQLPLPPGTDVTVLAVPPAHETGKPLPWIGTPALGYLTAGLAIAVLSGSGADANNLTATVSVMKEGAPLQPVPVGPMDFPGGPMTTNDVIRTARLEIRLDR